MKNKVYGTKPKKVGYFKYLKLRRKELGTRYSLEQVISFEQKYRPWGFVYFLHGLPWCLHDMRRAYQNYKVEHLKLGRQKWKNGKLYIEKIPRYIASEATDYLTAILRDYLRAYAKETYSIGNVLFEKNGEEGVSSPIIRAVGTGRDGALEDWRKMVNDTADLFDEAADLRATVWTADPIDDMDRLWKEYRKKLAEAFDHLKVIFHELDD